VTDLSFDPLPVLKAEGNSGSSTAKLAMTMLTQGDPTFRQPTRKQRRILAMAFAGREKILYGRAFDALRVPDGLDVDLDDLGSVEANLDQLVLYEIKSTNRKNLGDEFHGYFFALTAAELLVAQSLGEQFRFLLIHTLTGDRLELTRQALFQKARAIYPSWSVLF
jgi:hypothetical protein